MKSMLLKKALMVTLCAVIATPAMQAEGWGRLFNVGNLIAISAVGAVSHL